MDLVSNVLSTIKNSSMSGKKFVEVSYSKMVEEVVKILKAEEFIDGYKVFKPEGKAFKMLHIDIKYEGGVGRISQIKKISKPGRRVYREARKIREIMNGFGLSVVSTSRGIMSGKEARKKRLGGEVICEVY
jgi:small subunit ribosomal protein S8